MLSINDNPVGPTVDLWIYGLMDLYCLNCTLSELHFMILCILFLLGGSLQDILSVYGLEIE